MQTVTTSTRKSNTTLGAVSIILTGAALIYFYSLPQLRKAAVQSKLLNSQYVARVAERDSLLVVKQTLTTAEGQLAQAGVDLKKIAEVVPLYEDIPGVYLLMEDLVSSSQSSISGLTSLSYTVGAPAVESGGNLVKIPITLSAGGDYVAFKQFIAKAQALIRPIVITNLTITQQTGRPSDTRLLLPGTYALSASGYMLAHELSNAYTP